jgi:hypothetical protein
VKPSQIAANVEQDLKTSPEWRARLTTWGVYAAATGATLAMASHADASIIYGAANVSASITPNASFDFAMTPFQIGSHKVELGIGIINDATRFSVFAAIKGVGPNPTLFADQGFSSLIKFAPGQSILASGLGSAGFASRYGLARAIGSASGLGRASFGNFASGQTGLAGFVLLNGSSNFNFGWLQIKVSDPTSVGYMTEIQALGWAYNDAAFGPIAAGVTPEPSSAALALLASGAAGLLAWRRRRKA